MSNPPVPPTPDDSGQRKPPAYGQQGVPPYGQQPPSAPRNGEQAPQIPRYGQAGPPAPQYGGPPQYGEQAQYGGPPQYGQQAQYGEQPPQSGVPAYGEFPYGQFDSKQPQGPQGVPKIVNIAFWLIVGSGLAWVLSTLFMITLIDDPALRGEFERQMAASGTDLTYESIRGLLIGTFVAVAVIGAGLYALVALNIRKGRNWARILGTVFAALSLLSLFPLGPGTLAALAGIAGIVLLYTPDAAPYFQGRRPFANPYGSPGAPFGR